MKIVLLEHIQKLGQIGDIVDVKSGYARNYLLPFQKALRATDKNIRHFDITTFCHLTDMNKHSTPELLEVQVEALPIGVENVLRIAVQRGPARVSATIPPINALRND